jgi:hypothetical protein
MIDADAALKSTQYKAYLNAACELERVSLHDLSIRERIAFFLNAYQCMYIHYFLKAVNEGKGIPGQSQESYLGAIRKLVTEGQ